MQLSRTPDLAPWRRMLLAALAASVVAAVILAVKDGQHLDVALGDTDDAMRLFMVRALAAGQGWYDQKIVRLQPPYGVYMHWSRLIDGGLAGLLDLFRLALPPAAAEMAMRFIWPLLWIFPAALAAVAIARRLGGGAAVFACAILLAIDMPMFLQFRPGRIDHHNVQIALCMVAFAGAALGTVRGAALAGLATGLGMAIGLEALIFEVAVGAYFALRYPLGEDEDARSLQAYAAGLGLATVAFFLIQTPPWRWSVAACDAMAVNLVAGVAVAAGGLILAVALTAKADWRLRLAALAAVGVAAAAVYVGLDRNCLGGPFADVDARLKVFWLPNVQEIRPISRVWRTDHATVLSLIAPMLLGLIAWAWLARDPVRRRDGFLYLAGVLLLGASIAGWGAIRMAGYANWFAEPLIAAAVAILVERYARGAMLATAAAACVAVPMFTGAAAQGIDKQLKTLSAKPTPKTAAAAKPTPKAAPVKAAPAKSTPAKPTTPAIFVRGDRCFQLAAFAGLARQPAGIVLSEIDLGPFILAHTSSSALAAPYHRMSWGLVQARAALSTQAEAADVPTRKLGAAYVLECPTHARNADRVGMGADSLQKRLDAGKPPAWLEPLSTDGAVKVYRVKPAAPAG